MNANYSIMSASVMWNYLSKIMQEAIKKYVSEKKQLDVKVINHYG